MIATKVKDGFVKEATMAPIISITETTVTYDPSKLYYIRPYLNKKAKGWFLNGERTHQLYDLRWDRYVEEDAGYMK